MALASLVCGCTSPDPWASRAGPIWPVHERERGAPSPCSVNRSVDDSLLRSSTQLSRRRFLAAAGLAGMSAAMAGVATTTLAGSRRPPFIWSPGTPVATIAVHSAGRPRPWEGNPEATLANYRDVLAALAKGVAPRDLPLLSAFIEGDLTDLSPPEAYREVVQTVFSPDILYEYASAELRRTIDGARQHATTRGSQLAWLGAETAEAVIVAFHRTRDMRFVDLFVDYFDQVLGLRDSKLGIRDDRLDRAVPAWGDGTLVDGQWIAHVTTTARICYAPMEFARLTLGSPDLAGYRDLASKYIGATARALAVFDVDFRRVPGEDVYYYRRPGVGLWEPINHAHQVGRVLLRLHQLTGEARYGRRATRIVDVFLRSLRYDRRGDPFWRYFPYFEPHQLPGRPEEIWKASCTVPFLHQAALRRRLDPTIPDAAARSFVTNLVRGGELNTTIDPARFTALSPGYKFAARAAWIGGWLELAPREPEIFDRVVELLVAHRSDYLPHGWMGRPSIARGYAYCLGDGPV